MWLSALLSNSLQVFAIAVITCGVASCGSRAEKATQYRRGTDIALVISDLGKPDVDRPYRSTDPGHLCPPETVRILAYQRQPLFGLRILDDGAIAFICVDKTDRLLSVISSGP